MPSPDTVRNWKESFPEFAARYSTARDVGFDSIAESVLAIADDLTDEPASRRVRIEARLKLLAKWDPRRYGDKLAPENEGPSRIVVTIGGNAD